MFARSFIIKSCWGRDSIHFFLEIALQLSVDGRDEEFTAWEVEQILISLVR